MSHRWRGLAASAGSSRSKSSRVGTRSSRRRRWSARRLLGSLAGGVHEFADDVTDVLVLLLAHLAAPTLLVRLVADQVARIIDAIPGLNLKGQGSRTAWRSRRA